MIHEGPCPLLIQGKNYFYKNRKITFCVIGVKIIIDSEERLTKC
jgi:hypothetical protein